MFAIVDIAGKQYKVRENDELYVPHLDTERDGAVTFDRVLLVAEGDEVLVGTPAVEGAVVTATVLDHVKGDKVLVFKKIRRKRFKVKRGHRQQYTQIRIDTVAPAGEQAEAASESSETAPAPADVEAEA